MHTGYHTTAKRIVNIPRFIWRRLHCLSTKLHASGPSESSCWCQSHHSVSNVLFLSDEDYTKRRKVSQICPLTARLRLCVRRSTMPGASFDIHQNKQYNGKKQIFRC